MEVEVSMLGEAELGDDPVSVARGGARTTYKCDAFAKVLL